MRTRVVLLSLIAYGCSLIVPGNGGLTPDLVDGGPNQPDGGALDPTDGDVGPRDAGPGDSGPADAGPAPAAPQLRFPWNHYYTGSAHSGGAPAERNALRPRFMWEPVTDADRYEIEVSFECAVQTRETCAFAEGVRGEVAAPATEWRPEAALAISMAAPAGRRYFWRARACRADLCSVLSEVRFLDVGRSPSDFNGDGYADFAVSALKPDESLTAETDDRVFIFHGSRDGAVGTAAVVLVDPDPQTDRFLPGNLFGVSVAAGDLDADGFADLVVNSAEGETGSDRFHVFYGSAAGLSMASMDTIERASLERWWSLAIGDVDADGYDDVITARASAEDAGGANTVSVFRGSSAGPRASTDLVVPVGGPSEDAPPAISIVGDIEGDGNIDVGCPGTGSLHILHGARDDILRAEPSVRAVPLDDLREVAGGDVDRDGFADVVVSAPAADGLLPQEGRVLLFRGGRTGLATTADQEIRSPVSESCRHFGTGLSTVADLNGDGYGDLIVGADRYRSCGSSVPVEDDIVYVFLGTSGALEPSPAATFTNPPTSGGADTRFGSVVATVGDTNGDGFNDAVVTAFQWNGRSESMTNWQGMAYGYYGRGGASGPVQSLFLDDVTTGEPRSRFGIAVSSGR